jgi:hypothetical protein
MRSLETKFHGEEDPYGDGFVASPRRFEAPAANCIGRRVVQVTVPRGPLHRHVGDPAVGRHEDPK